MALQGGNETVVSARDLSIHYRSINSPSEFVAVRGVNLEISRGEIVGMVGESGSGKSTLAATIAGVTGFGTPGSDSPEISGGGLTVLGTQMRGITKRQRDRLTLRVGYLAQEGAERLNPQFTAAENVAEPIYSRDRRFSAREAGAAVATLIDAVHLPLGVMQLLPFELSSGQRQRVALARALILEPELLVADEPTRGVDVNANSTLLDIISELQKERQMAALIVSSSLSVVERIASRTVVMQRGVIVGLGEIGHLLDDPHHPYLKGLAKSRP